MWPLVVWAIGSWIGSNIVGFVTALIFKKEKKDPIPKHLTGGVKRYDFYKETMPWARTIAKYTTLGLSEWLLDHEKYTRSEYHYNGNDTTEFLGSDKDEVVTRLSAMGMKCIDEGKHAEARDYFNAGYEISKTTDAKREFKIKRDNANAEVKYEEGINYQKTGNFKKAKLSFQAALDLTHDEDRRDGFLESRNNASAEIMYQKGLQHMKTGNSQDAKISFHAAINLTRSANRRKVFEDSIDNCNAEVSNEEGLGYLNTQHFEQAKNSLQRAFELCKCEERRQVIQVNLNNALAELSYQNGHRLLETASNRTHYKNAHELLLNAANTCSNGYSRREIFVQSAETVSDIVQRTIRAENLFEEGKKLWDQACNDEKDGKVDDATQNLRAARRKLVEACEVFNCETYNKWAKMCSNKINGCLCFNRSIDVIKRGDELAKAGQHREARRHYETANELLNKALEEFNKGLVGIKDTTFNAGITFVQGCIDDTIHPKIDIANLNIPGEIAQNNQQGNQEDQGENQDYHQIVRHI